MGFDSLFIDNTDNISIHFL